MDEKGKSLLLVAFQFAYMTRSPLRVGEKFLDKLCENIEESDIDDEKIENRLMALAIKAFGSNPISRCKLCNNALGIIEALAC